jgi:hypothetical protein
VSKGPHQRDKEVHVRVQVLLTTTEVPLEENNGRYVKSMGTFGDHFVGKHDFWPLRADNAQVGIVVITLYVPLPSLRLVTLNLLRCLRVLLGVNLRQIHINTCIS